MCIKTLPSTLVIQLKRFYYDWDAGRSLKFDDYFQFPWELDMAPYTAEGIQERDRHDSSSSNSATESTSTSSAATATSKNRSSLTLSSNNPRLSPCNYELVGVVVHSGQASAGHYYSFIKERKKSGAEGANRNRWLKFNDTTVEEFDMNDTTLEAECFGGTYKAKSYDSSKYFHFF
jgi:ubiquitin carboxyl-terminal hydrolase 9/24